MAEYIERQAAKNAFGRMDTVIGKTTSIAIDSVPTADVAPVVHGRWIMRGGHFHCSSCDAKAKWDREGGTGGWSHEYVQAKTPFCPVCGAKLDKEAPDEQ